MTFKERLFSMPGLAVSAAALLALGGSIGAIAAHGHHRVDVMAPAAPVPVRGLAAASQPLVPGAESVVTVRGRIVRVFGSQFVLNDGTGDVLVDTGRRWGGGDTAEAMTAGQTVTVQGRYDDGTVQARYLVSADGRVAALRGGERHGRGHGDRRGGRGEGEFHPEGFEAPSPAPQANAVQPVPSGSAK